MTSLKLLFLGAASACYLVLSSASFAGTQELIFTDGFESGDTCAWSSEADASCIPPLTSDWHPDPDGDGVASSLDLCPHVYDPLQADDDNDGVGDFCDPDFSPPVEGGSVSDLRAEHVTPYGAWLRFTSPHTTEYGWDGALAWSTDRTELESLTAFEAVVDRGDFLAIDINAPFARRLPDPIIVNRLTPDTITFLAFTRERDDGGPGYLDEISNIVEIRTLPGPQPQTTGGHPRVWLTTDKVTELQARRAGADSAWVGWEALLAPSIQAAATDPDNEYQPWTYCPAAAMLRLASNDGTYLSESLILFDLVVAHWQTGLVSNQYRWADAVLGICLDLLWNDLDASQRNQAMTLMLDTGENPINLSPRHHDTDEMASSTRSQIIDGLVGCGSNDLPTDLQSRACTLLDEGLRKWFGIQMVKARRDRGLFAQSGGYLPDGTRYGMGTGGYWWQTFWALLNAGVPAGENMRFVANNLLQFRIHPLTPTGLGFVTISDIEDLENNLAIEPFSFGVEAIHAAPLAIQMGILEASGYDLEAGWARLLLDRYEVTEFSDRVHMLLFVHDGLAPIDYQNEIPTARIDSGFGLLFDRSSWGSEASHLTFQAGWQTVDHRHGDVGNFHLFRRGRWITHEAAGSGGQSDRGVGHNVLRLEIPFLGPTTEIDQYLFFPSNEQRILAASSAEAYTYAVAETTGAYTSYREHGEDYDRVQRHLIWLKTDGSGSADRVVIYDLVDESADAAPALEREWSLHLDFPATITGRNAEVMIPGGDEDQRLEVDVLLPTAATLELRLPEPGDIGDYPTPLYTHRLVALLPAGGPLRMVTVLRASDASAPGIAAPVAVDVVGHRGALLGEDLVVFPEDPRPGGWDQASVRVETSAPLEVWIGGMLPGGSFTARATLDGSFIDIVVTMGGDLRADTAGLLAFSIAADLSTSQGP